MKAVCWDYPIRGISTPSAQWMADLWKAQQAGEDLEPHPSSQQAARLPDPKVSRSEFPGHAAWIDGDWSIARGAFFAGTLDEREHMLPVAWPHQITRQWLPFIAMDWGSSAPSVVYVCLVSLIHI